MAPSPELPIDRSPQPVKEREEQLRAIEGQSARAEGNSEHLFRPYDFMKENVVQVDEGDTKDTKANDKVRHPCDTLNPALPSVQIIEGHFVSAQGDSDGHLFDEEDRRKEEAILT